MGDLVNWPERLADAQFAIIDPLWKKHCAPYIFAVMEKFSDDTDILERSLVLCEHYLFRQGLVCKDSVSVLQKVFSDAAALVKAGDSVEELIDFCKRNSPDANFIDNFKVFSARNLKQGFYAIWKIEAFITDQKSVEFRPKSQSAAQHLEHIMPKKPGADWKGIKQEEGFSRSLNRLGNFLVLNSSINQHIKNKSLAYKCNNPSSQDYKNSGLELPAEFVDKLSSWAVNGEWNFDAINLRQIYLAEKYAGKVWDLSV